MDVILKVWNKYINKVKKRIEFYMEMKTQNVFSAHFEEHATELVYKCKYNFKDILVVMQ